MGLRVLVAAASVAIIAAVAYYFWSEVQAKQQASQAASEKQRMRAELFKYAEAKPDDEEKVRRLCQSDLEQSANELYNFKITKLRLSYCRALNYLPD